MGDLSGRRWPTVAAFVVVIAVAGGSVWRIEQVADEQNERRNVVAARLVEVARIEVAERITLAEELAESICRERNETNDRVRAAFALQYDVLEVATRDEPGGPEFVAELRAQVLNDLLAPHAIDRDCTVGPP